VRWLAIAVLAIAAPALAAPARVVVLPLDGDAPSALRQSLASDLATAARDDGDVTVGTTTFRESAAAIGCDPDDDACATTVVATLGVDEIVYGAATADGATTHVRIARVTRDQRAARAFDVPGDTSAELRALFGGNAPTPPPPVVAPARPGGSFFDTRDRTVGFALAAGGGIAIVIGIALWASENSLQSQIDNAPNATLIDVQALVALESRASNDAWAGNVLFVLGLAAGGVGGYLLWRDHRARTTVAPTDHGVALVVEGQW
jgi:hypothetical protein